MKPITELLDLKSMAMKPEASNISDFDTERTKKFVNRLFKRFEAILPGFSVSVKSEEHLAAIKREWVETFIEARLSDVNLIQVGLKKLQKSFDIYLPKASVFVRWCRESMPEDLGFPHFSSLFYMAIRINAQFSDYVYPNENLDLIIRHAIDLIGKKEFREMPYLKAQKAFEASYELSCRQFVSDKFKSTPKLLENKQEKIIEWEKKQQIVKEEFKDIRDHTSAMAEMRKILGMTSREEI